MKEALTEGPVAVTMAVANSMLFYAGGVFNDPSCGYGPEAPLDHEVTAVGWGHDADYGDYWIIRNSWSNFWGMDGYFYISMDNDLCGILQNAMYYTMKNPAPETQYHFTGTFSLPYSNIT